MQRTAPNGGRTDRLSESELGERWGRRAYGGAKDCLGLGRRLGQRDAENQKKVSADFQEDSFGALFI